MESAMKMARQYYMELSPQEPKRINFIAREGSYHGTTLGSLSMSGHVARRSLFLDLLLPNIAKVSACNPYRGMMVGQTTEEYVVQLADELDRKFQDLGPDTVCAFVAEPVVGAFSHNIMSGITCTNGRMQTLGCVPAVPGYFKAMKSVCDKYGALLIFDDAESFFNETADVFTEVMSGMGRSGTLHAWQQEHVVPDIQTIAKGLGAVTRQWLQMLLKMELAKGLSLMGTPTKATQSALEVQRIIREEELVSNVQKQGVILEKLLRKYLDDHPYVGNIRGKGLFWGVSQRNLLRICVVWLTISVYRLNLSMTKRAKGRSHDQQISLTKFT
ncbi:LOW QUALITY PROTEIN: aminotransferase [Colletotrichum tofieldiae]|nr:LOW QUALITY PROTEIN: aminotransferase [Colletotrichum tofieldiae]